VAAVSREDGQQLIAQTATLSAELAQLKSPIESPKKANLSEEDRDDEMWANQAEHEFPESGFLPRVVHNAMCALLLIAMFLVAFGFLCCALVAMGHFLLSYFS